MFYVTDHNYNVRAEYADAKSAVERANRDGLVICQRDEDGRLRLYADIVEQARRLFEVYWRPKLAA